MIPKSFDSISKEDLDQLVINKVKEGRTLQYKPDSPRSSSQIILFLAVISELANNQGGDMVLGISKDDGLPSSVQGLKIANINRELLRLQSLISDGLEPSLESVELRSIEIDKGNYVVIIRVRPSRKAPHSVSLLWANILG